MMIRYASLIAKRERGKKRWVAIPKRGSQTVGCSDYFGLSDTVDLATMPFLFIGRALNSRM